MLHSCDATLFAYKLLSEGYPRSLKKVGNNNRKKRDDLTFMEKDVATVLGVTTEIVANRKSIVDVQNSD